MADHKDETLTGRVQLDGKVFENVTFKGAQLFYSGGVMPSFKSCNFDKADVIFNESAGNTLTFLRAMAPASTGLRSIVEGLFPEMKG